MNAPNGSEGTRPAILPASPVPERQATGGVDRKSGRPAISCTGLFAFFILKVAMSVVLHHRRLQSIAHDQTQKEDQTRKELFLYLDPSNRNALFYKPRPPLSAEESTELAYMLSRVANIYLDRHERRNRGRESNQPASRLEIRCDNKVMRVVPDSSCGNGAIFSANIGIGETDTTGKPVSP